MPKFIWTLVLCVVALFATTATASVSVNEAGWQRHSKTLYSVSKKTDVKMSDLVVMASIESTMGKNLSNKRSSAKGLFGFTDRTWRTTLKRYGAEYGLPRNAKVKDPRANALMAVAYMKENKEFLERSLQRRVGINEIYMAHLLGPADAVKILKAKNGQSAIAAVGGKNGNRTYFYNKGKPRTVGGFKTYVANVVNSHRSAYSSNLTLFAFKHELSMSAVV